MLNKLTFSYSCTSLGFWLTGFLIPLVILDLSHSAFLVTLSYAVNIVPYIVVTPFAGAFGDLFNRKKIIVTGELCCAITGLGLYLVPFQQSNVSVIICLGFIISVFAAIHHPIFQTIIPDVFESERIKHVNANIGVIDSLVSIVAPIFLGVLLIKFDKKIVILFVVFFYILSFLFFLVIPYSRLQKKEPVTFNLVFLSLKEGIAYVMGNLELKKIVMLFFGVNFGIRLVFPNLMWIFSSLYHLSDRQIAPYFLVIGVGAVAGAKIAPLMIDKFSDVKIISGCTFLVAVFSFLLMLSANPFMVAFIWALSSLFQSIIIVTFFTYRQKITENFILGRVVSVTRLISYLAIPAATLVSGCFLETNMNIDFIYFLSGCVIFVSVCFYFFAGRKGTLI